MAHTERLQTTPLSRNHQSIAQKRCDGSTSHSVATNTIAPLSPDSNTLSINASRTITPTQRKSCWTSINLPRTLTILRWATGVVNPAQDLIAYAEDTLSRRIYTLRIKAVGSDITQPDVITGAAPSMAWSQDGQSLFYHQETIRRRFSNMKSIGINSARIKARISWCIGRQTQPTHFGWKKSRSKAFIFIRASSTESTEILIIPRKTPLAAPYPLLARTDQHEYRARHLNNHFYLLTNDEAPELPVDAR